MGHARGVVLLCIERAGLKLVELGATEVKKSLTGNGHAGKDQMQRGVQHQLSLLAPPRPADVADAIAIAVGASGEAGAARIAPRSALRGSPRMTPRCPRAPPAYNTTKLPTARQEVLMLSSIRSMLTRSHALILAASVRRRAPAAPPPAPARADTTVFDNGIFITGTGTARSNGVPIIRAEGSAITIGFNEHATAAQGGPIRVADDFVISSTTPSAPGGVQLTHMHFYAVQSNAVTTDVHFAGFYIALYDAAPFGGGHLIAGDFTTSRLLSSTFSGVYREPTTGTLLTNFPITMLDVDMSWAPRLAPGTYWMEVSAAGDPALSATPNPQTIFVTPHSPNVNAEQFYGGNWYAIWDLPFTLFAQCPADFNNSGAATVQDIFDFLTAWFAADPRADLNGTGGITVQDIFDFLAAWFAGC